MTTWGDSASAEQVTPTLSSLRFLLLEDNLLDAQRAQATLRDGGIDCELARVETRADFLAALEKESFDLILADYALHFFNGISALEIAHNLCPEVPFIFVSETLGEELAIKMLKSGATDYVLKQRLWWLVPAVQQALRYVQERSDRKQTEASLQQAEAAILQSEEQFRSLVLATSQAVWISNAEGQVVKDNPSWRALTGQSEEAFKGWGWLDAIHPEEREQTTQRWNQAIASKSVYEFENRVRTADGTYRLFCVRAVPILDQNGDIREWIGAYTDITDRKWAESVLRDREERLRAALFASGTGTFRWDIRTNAVDWDENLARLFGLPEGQAVPRLEAFVQLVHPDDRASLVSRCERCAQEGADFEMDLRVVWPDGSVHWLADKGKTFFDAEGKPLYMTGACVDITERKQAESERARLISQLRQSEERYRCLVTATSSIVGTVTGNGAFVEDVPSWQDFTGQTPQQYKSFGWLNAIHSDDRQPMVEIWHRAWQNTTPFEVEYRLRHYDGEYRHVVARGVPILDAGGKVREWVGTVTDIHDQRQAEEKLRQTEAKLMGLFRSGVVGIMWGEEELILECNDEMLRMVGYTRDELLDGGLNWNEMTPLHERDRRAMAVQEAIETGRFAPFENNFIRKDGSIVPTILGGSCLGTNPFRYVSFILDISSRKRAEEQVLVSLREKEVLLKEIHHRVKNNLQVICSLLRLQSEYIDDELALKSFEATQLRVKSMALIHQKLYKSNDLSRIDAAEYIKSLAIEVFRSYNVTNQTISLEINADNVKLSPDPAISCSLILCELISNALKHAFPHQENARIDIQLSSNGDMFSLQVSDNGVGLPEDLDFRNTESLGLQLVMELVEQLEGEISLQSLGGTTFKIDFMVSAPEER